MLQVAFVGALTGRYVDFTSAQIAALHMTAARAGRSLTDAEASVIVGAMRRLPPHPDARPGIERLREAGFTITALTNSLLDVAQDQRTTPASPTCLTVCTRPTPSRRSSRSRRHISWWPTHGQSTSRSSGWSLPTAGTSVARSRRVHAQGSSPALAPPRFPSALSLRSSAKTSTRLPFN